MNWISVGWIALSCCSCLSTTKATQNVLGKSHQRRLKGKRSEDARWPWMYKIYKYLHVQAFCGCSINIYATLERFGFRRRFSGCRRVGSLFTDEEQKKGWLATYVNTSTTHADLLHDDTDTDCQTQNSSTRGHVFVTFKRRSKIHKRLKERFFSLIGRNRTKPCKFSRKSSFFKLCTT